MRLPALVLLACSIAGAVPASDTGLPQRLAGHVQNLAGRIGERNVAHYGALEAAGAYIEDQLTGMGYRPARQVFDVEGRPVRNIEVEIQGTSRPRQIVVVGAHYDSVAGAPGANDNGSGVAAVLEIARAFSGRRPARSLRFVAFVNEEPPYFGSADMGSRRYAERCRQRGENVVAMLSLETIGYYSDAPGSQRYPYEFLRWLYPDRGNFLAFVGNLGSLDLARRSAAAFRAASPLPVEWAALPGGLEGVYWSDHWAFWESGYDALMVTDTAPFRYPDYHRGSDTPDKLDYGRMGQAVQGLVGVVEALGG